VQIDWFTLVAQIVNFLILLYLLKRFLYGTIIETMDKREQKIAARLQEAEEKRSEAEQQVERYRRQRRELEEQRDEQLAQIRQEVETRRKELLDEAHQEVQEKKQDWQAALRREQDAFLRDLCQHVGREAGEITRRALQDLADVQVERRMVDLFVARIRELEPGKKAEISASIQKSDGEVVIRSAFELPTEVQQTLIEAVQAHLLDGSNLRARFEIAPDLISGVELGADGHQVAWTIRDYLDHLEEQIRQTLQHETQEGNDSDSAS
jgi:F-type H+-transporting ATPase subunit b